MCGRIIKDGKEIMGDGDFNRSLARQRQLFWKTWLADREAGGAHGYNLKPTERISFVRSDDSGEPIGLVGRWGLEPRWIRDPKQLKTPLFNARSETAAEKPSFRDAIKHDRCVILVDAFYEWQAITGQAKKQPWVIRRADGEPMILAGLCASHEWGESFTILTTSPNTLMAPIHDRMPVVLDPDSLEHWLDPATTDPREIEDLLRPCPPDWLEAKPLIGPVGDWPPETAA